MAIHRFGTNRPSPLPPIIRGGPRPAVTDQQDREILVRRPYQDTPFYVAAPLVVGGNTGPVLCVSFTLPRNMIGILTGVWNSVDNNADWDNVVWQLKIGERTATGLDDVEGPIGLAALFEPTAYGIDQGATVAWFVTNTHAAALNATAGLRGYFWATPAGADVVGA